MVTLWTSTERRDGSWCLDSKSWASNLNWFPERRFQVVAADWHSNDSGKKKCSKHCTTQHYTTPLGYQATKHKPNATTTKLCLSQNVCVWQGGWDNIYIEKRQTNAMTRNKKEWLFKIAFFLLFDRLKREMKKKKKGNAALRPFLPYTSR